MPIWGRHDSEPPPEAHESQAGANASQAGANASQAEAHDTREPADEYQAGEPAPAFWRAQGQTPASLGRDPADAPPPDYGHVPPGGPAAAHEQQASGEAPVPAMNEAQEPAVAESGGGGQEAAMAEAERPAVAPEPAVAEAYEPVAAEAHESAVYEPAVVEASEPAVVEGSEPAVVEASEPAVVEASEPAVAQASEPAVAQAHEPSVAEPTEPVVTRAEQPAAATITPQRWSEIMVAFVDDPRGSVKMAADAVDEAIDEFVNSVRARQRDLASTWQSAGADTEQLRIALREYRKLGQRVRQLDLGEKTGG